TTGNTTTYENIGKTANKGIDISVTTLNINTKHLTWTTTLNASWQKDHIVSLSNGTQPDISNLWFPGQPLNVIYGYKALGLWHTTDDAAIKAFNANGNKFSPGNVRIADLNGDNKIDANNDRQIIGWTRPRWVVGMTNTINYKVVELSFFLYGRLNYLYNYGGEAEAARYVTRQVNYYNENNTNADIQKPIFNAGGAPVDPYYAALGYLKASFIKIRNISLGYNFAGKKLENKGISNLKVYVQMTNPGMLFYKIKFLIPLAIIAAVLFITSSCKKSFLNENLTTAATTDFYKTDAGILQLAVGTYYQVFSAPENGEWYFSAANYGTDEFHVGGDPSNSPWNNYDQTFNPGLTTNGNLQGMNVQWDALYTGIGAANLLIQNARNSTSTSVAVKSTSLGEGLFMRAYNYLRLVSQYGGVPLVTQPTSAVTLEYTRATPEDVFKQIIIDLDSAHNLLPNSGGPYHITKDAAAHYLAKAYLSRASEINSSWNSATVTSDLTTAATLCDEVIANHPLAPDFKSLWNFTGINSANESLPEVILSAQFTNDVTTNLGNGNTQHLYFVSRYDIQDQMARDLTGDRPFSRMASTYYD